LSSSQRIHGQVLHKVRTQSLVFRVSNSLTLFHFIFLLIYLFRCGSTLHDTPAAAPPPTNSNVCSKCHFANAPNARFCGGCGSGLAPGTTSASASALEAERRKLEEARAALEREKRDAERRAKELEQARVEAEREAERLRRDAEARTRELERARLEAERETERLRREREEAERDAANLRREQAEASAAAAAAQRKREEEELRRQQDDERRRLRDEEDKRRAAAAAASAAATAAAEEAAAAKKREEDEAAAAAAEARRAREDEIRKKKEDVEKRKQELEETRRKRLEDEREKQAAAAKAQREQLEREKQHHADKIERKLSEKKIEPVATAAAAAADTYQYVPGQADGLKSALQTSAAVPSSPPRVSPRAPTQQYATIPLKPKEAPKLPPGWEQHTTDDGEVYYYNEALDESSWVLPSGSGGRWTRHLDDNGDVYFYNPVTDESKWELSPEDEALLDEDNTEAVFETAPVIPSVPLHALPARPATSTAKPLPQRAQHMQLPPGPVPAAPKRDAAKPTAAAAATTATAPTTSAPLPSSPKLGARPPTEKKKSLFGKLKQSFRGSEKRSNGSAVVSAPTPAATTAAAAGARGSPPAAPTAAQAEKNKGKLRKWAKYRRSLEKAQVGLSDYVVRYKGDEGGDGDSAVDVSAELAKTEKELAAARDMQTKFAVMYASNPTERAKLEAEIEELSLKVEQLKAQNAPPDLSGDELLQAALRAPVVARCRAKWKYDVVYDGELGFEEGDVIEVIEKVDDTWWHGRLKNRAGMFSKDFVTEI
jgi:hypothetical protein